ncbi:MAG: oligosaccharide repeat unit polymerase [Candidatus Riflebacteria bacterium]|nr:oligosaccharide repeat unit polymerase [Candidatus Riflebacteria bacterium]
MANQLDENNIALKSKEYIFYIFIFWSSLVLLGLYFANNTLYLDKVGGVSLGVLISIFGIFALESLFIFLKKNKNYIFVNRSVFFLLLLILYVSIRIITDKSDINYLRTFWFSTSFGSLIFYMLGGFIACVATEINNLAKKNKFLSNCNYFLGYFYIFCNLLFNLYVFFRLLPRKRPVFFLIDSFGFYQRPANFIIINTFLIAYCYFSIQSNSKRNYLLDIIYFCYYIITILLVQFIGSNNGFLGVFGIMFFSMIYKIYLSNKYKKEQKLFDKKRKATLVTKYIITFFKNLGLISVYLFIILLMFFVVFRKYMPPVRILHYNLNEEYNPLDERFKSLKDNFIPQFSLRPIEGNMEAETIISGEGTQIHSFILSMMTHIGIIGVTLFILYLLFALKEFHNSLCYSRNYNSFCLNLFIFLLAIFIFFMANISSFFSWNPIWFTFGFCFPIIYYRQNNIKYNLLKNNTIKLELINNKNG